MVLTQPKIIEDIHRAYLEAGADIVATDTFNGNALSLGEFQLAGTRRRDQPHRRRARPPRRRRLDAAARPTSRASSPAASGRPTRPCRSASSDDPGRRDVTFDQMVAVYAEQVRALVDGGVDILLPETSFDTLVMKACLFAIDKVL